MKFFSKSAFLGLVIKNGIPANRIAGLVGAPTRLIKFEEGVVEIDDKDQETIDLMLAHPDCGILYWKDSDSNKPNLSINQMEPRHVITEFDHGEIGKSTVSSGNNSEQEQLLMKMAKAMITEMLKSQVAQQAPKEQKDPIELQPQEEETTPSTPEFKLTPSEKRHDCFGRSLTVKEAAEEYKIDGRSLNALINIRKMTLEEAIAHKQAGAK